MVRAVALSAAGDKAGPDVFFIANLLVFEHKSAQGALKENSSRTRYIRFLLQAQAEFP
jgi:hypothetical protein